MSSWKLYLSFSLDFQFRNNWLLLIHFGFKTQLVSDFIYTNLTGVKSKCCWIYAAFQTPFCLSLNKNEYCLIWCEVSSSVLHLKMFCVSQTSTPKNTQTDICPLFTIYSWLQTMDIELYHVFFNKCCFL